MGRRSFVSSIAIALLLALPELGAAQYWEVRDTSTNQVVYPSGTVSVLEDIVSPFLAQRVYSIRNVSTFSNLQFGPCSLIGDPSFVISAFPYPSGQSSAPISPGLPTSMAVQHLPYTPGTQSATVQCFAFGGVVTFQVRGRILDQNPFIILQTLAEQDVPKGSTFTFDPTQTGIAVTKDFRIINLGNQTMTISLSLTGSAYSVVSPPPASIAKGSEATFSLRLLSAISGTITGQLRIDNNDPNDNPYTVNLTGSVSPAPAPQIRITDNGNGGAVVAKGGPPINIGATPTNAPLDRTFTITNTGNATLSITNPSTFLSGTGFTLVSSPPSSIAPSGSGAFTIRFLAGAAGIYNGSISIGNNDPSNNPYFFGVTATALAPRIRIVSGSTPIAKGGLYLYPDTPVGAAEGRVFTIYNDGNQTLTISNFALNTAGGFSVLIWPPSSIAPGGSGIFRIRLLSATPGQYSATVSFNNNDPGNNPFFFELRGTVVPAGPVPDIRIVSGDGVTVANGGIYSSFPSTPPGVSVSRLFTIYNDGSATLTISNPSSLVSGAGFSLIVVPPSSIAAGSSGVFRVRLLASSAGTYTGTVNIQSNDPDENPFTFQIRGTVTN